MLAIECSRRFWTAPNVARAEDTAEIAASIALIAVELVRLVKSPRVLPSEIVLTVMDSPSFTPTWKVTAPDVASSVMPLNFAEPPMRSISDASWLTSVWIAA